jgi:hypothetical protein
MTTTDPRSLHAALAVALEPALAAFRATHDAHAAAHEAWKLAVVEHGFDSAEERQANAVFLAADIEAKASFGRLRAAEAACLLDVAMVKPATERVAGR